MWSRSPRRASQRAPAGRWEPRRWLERHRRRLGGEVVAANAPQILDSPIGALRLNYVTKEVDEAGRRKGTPLDGHLRLRP
eukprot:3594548-Lingulodinium_polyedra.AAC.1